MNKNKKALQTLIYQGFSRLFVWQGQKDLTVCCGFALRPFRSATEILTNFSTRLTLLAKNVPSAHFLNAKTLTGSSPLLLYEK